MNSLLKLLSSATIAASLSFVGPAPASAQGTAQVRRGDDSEQARAPRGPRAEGARRGPRAEGARRGPRAHRGHRGRHGMQRMLRQLELTENQQTQVRAIMESAREEGRALREADGNREAMHAHREETKRLVMEVLTPAQRARAAELRTEHQANRITRRLTHMTERLSLSAAQQTRIRAILESAATERSPQMDRAAHQARHRAMRTQIESVLTAEQRALLPEPGERRERRGRRGHGPRGENGPRGQVGVDNPDNRGI